MHSAKTVPRSYVYPNCLRLFNIGHTSQHAWKAIALAHTKICQVESDKWFLSPVVAS